MIMQSKLESTLKELEDGWKSSGCGAVDDFIHLWCTRFHTRAWNITREKNSILFQTEISSIRFRGMGIVPVLLVGGNGASVVDAINRFRHNGWHGSQLPIVLFVADSAYAAGSTLLAGRKGVRLSPFQIRQILLAQDPIDCLRREILRQVPFRRLIPFTTTHPAEGTMFFGRHDELEMLLYESNADYFLCGKGFMGKTSLLRQVQWTLRHQLDPRLQRMVEIDLYTCPPDINVAARDIARAINPTKRADRVASIHDLEKFFAREHSQNPCFEKGPIELLIDEVDEVLAEDMRQGYPLLKALRHARSKGLIRLTLCGRTGPFAAYKDIRSGDNPLAERMKLLHLLPLDNRNAKRLLLLPLEQLGIKIECKNELIDRVLSTSSGVPLLIQKWGVEIAERATRNEGHAFTLSDLLAIEKGFGV